MIATIGIACITGITILMLVVSILSHQAEMKEKDVVIEAIKAGLEQATVSTLEEDRILGTRKFEVQKLWRKSVQPKEN